jgi:hypothetical protein
VDDRRRAEYFEMRCTMKNEMREVCTMVCKVEKRNK